MAEPCPLIEISGSPYERGMQYGNQAAARIKRGLQHYGEQLRRLDLDAPATAALIADYLPVIDAFDDSLHPRDARHRPRRGCGVRGRGAAQRANGNPQARHQPGPARRPAPRPARGRVEDGCTGIVAPARRDRATAA